MTDTIEQLAREIATGIRESAGGRHGALTLAAFMGIKAGIQLERDRCAAIAKDYRENAGGSESYRRACDHIETTIRSQGK